MSNLNTGFDKYAAQYEAALHRGISVSGESQDYFARRRIVWLGERLARLGERPKRILDFGCGTGAATRFFLELVPGAVVTGIDVSELSLEVARQANPMPRAEFIPLDRYTPKGDIDVAFCNGVFHHIPIESRGEAVHYVYRSLRVGGLFAFWENNPWNPGTRYVMSRIPFDRDAVPLSAPVGRALLRRWGFDVVTTEFLFIFPRLLRCLRGLEPSLSHLPLGAQYQILCRKRDAPVAMAHQP
jgi:SAM-dependent methyltransferase